MRRARAEYILSCEEMMSVKKSLGTTLTALRREAGLTQPQVAGLLAREGFSLRPAAISKWEKDLTQPNAAQFLALCRIYAVRDVLSAFLGEPGALSGLNAEGRRLVDGYIRVLLASGLYAEPAPAPARTLPLYHLAASAGTGQFLDGDSSEPIDASGAPEGADFAVRIAGDSMEPEIEDGRIVWVRSRDELEPGVPGIFIYRGEAYCKRLRTGKNGAQLVSVNPSYAPIDIREGEALRVCGEVVGLGPMAG